jgi:hypothetical protein
MKTRCPHRPFAAVALLAAVLLSGSLARAEAATAGRTARQARREAARGTSPAEVSTTSRWISWLLAEVGLAPTPAPQPPKAGSTVTSTTQTTLSDNGAGIDPNG